ncbi:MAG: serine/threonine-protein phosphatase [Proteobacteria bacterium]|jgi:PPM family protein phosphatase|nr:serine/threonine-protein phosphatase [Pseudomonadota bacterium]
MQFEFGRTSRLGNRTVNQDRLAVIENEAGTLLVLGDGLGGKPGGELAAQTLVDSIVEELALNPLPAEYPEKFLHELLRRAHHAILLAGQEQSPPISPGTTAVICLIQNRKAWWAHVGDSRIYLFRNSLPLYRTQDHSYVEQLYQEGRISLKKTHNHPLRNYVTRCIGLFPHEPSITVSQAVELKEGDVLLLCSDGFWEPLDEAQMGTLIEQGRLNDALNQLAERAESAKYPHSDNTSAVAARVISLQELRRTTRQQTSKNSSSEDNLLSAIEEIQQAIETYSDEMKK